MGGLGVNISELILDMEQVVFTYEHKAPLGYTDFYITDKKTLLLRRGAAGGLTLGVIFHDQLAGVFTKQKVYGALRKLGKVLLAFGILALLAWITIEYIKSSALISSYIVIVKDFTYLRDSGLALLVAGVVLLFVYWGYRPSRLVLMGGGMAVDVPKLPEEKVEEVVRLLTSYRERQKHISQEPTSVGMEI